MKHGMLALLVCGLALAQAASAAPVNTCADVGLPVGGIENIQCTVYSNGSPNTFDLSSLMTYGGALLSNNDYQAGYYVVINGNPNTLPDTTSGLLNQSLWQAVLDFPGGDPDGTYFSDMLQVFWPGTFPSTSTIQSYDLASYEVFNGGSPAGYADSAYFIPSTGNTTVVSGPNGDITLITATAANTPEPASFWLMLAGVLGLGLFAGVKSMRNLPCRPIA